MYSFEEMFQKSNEFYKNLYLINIKPECKKQALEHSKLLIKQMVWLQSLTDKDYERLKESGFNLFSTVKKDIFLEKYIEKISNNSFQ